MIGKKPKVKSEATAAITRHSARVCESWSREPMKAPTTWSEGTQIAMGPRSSAEILQN